MTIERVPELQVLHRGARSEAARALQAATNRRLRSRQLDAHVVEEDGVVGRKTLAAVTTAAWALGARRETLATLDHGEIAVGVQRMIRNPGLRTDEQKLLGKKRVANMLRERAEREAAAAAMAGARKRIVRLAQQAAANYRRTPGAYHYLAAREGEPRLHEADAARLALGLLAVRRRDLQGRRSAVAGERRAPVGLDVLDGEEGSGDGASAARRPGDVRQPLRSPPRGDLLRRAGPGVHRPRVAADRLADAGPTGLLPDLRLPRIGAIS